MGINGNGLRLVAGGRIRILLLLQVQVATLFFLLSLYNGNVNGLTVAVFGGSGYVGRRISQTLIEAGCDVISISRTGKPPKYYCNNYMDMDMNMNNGNGNGGDTSSSTDTTDGAKKGTGMNSNWAELVSWIRYDMDPKKRKINGEKVDQSQSEIYQLELPKIDAAISCIGNVNPNPNWVKSTFFGLGFDDEKLYYENGILNEYAIQISKKAGAKRFVFISVSYEVAKMLEGPIPGYINGKRNAEHVAYDLFGSDGAFVLGPSLIYGGKRFSTLGDRYRQFVESTVAKLYVSGNEALRNLSSAPIEDWVEKTIFSSPVKVDVVARVAAAAAMGFVRRDLVGERRQGFYSTDGKPILYDDVIFIDGTKEIERVDEIVSTELVLELMKEKQPQTRSGSAQVVESVKTNYFAQNEENDPSENHNDHGSQPPYAEGALIGKGPLLFPLPVVAFFGTVFYLVSSGQFTAGN